MAQTFTREALYNLVWAEPKTALAKKFGVSDVWLSKICRSVNIPLPPCGYWAKVAAGKKPPKLALRRRDLGEVDEVTIGQERWSPHEERIIDLPPAPIFADSLDDIIAQAKKRLGRVRSVGGLADPHYLIAELLEADELRRKEAEGTSYVWDKPLFDEASARRRLKILNALFLALNKGGFRPTMRGKSAEEPGVVVGDFHVSFKLEKIQQRSRAAKRSPGRPKEPLQLEISNWTQSPVFPKQSWRDTDTESLENLLPEIAISLVAAGEMLYRGDQIRRYNWIAQRKAEQDERIRAEKEKVEREAEAARMADLQRRRQALFQLCENRVKAEQIRALVAEIEQRPGAVQCPDFRAWKDWALAEANSLDPLCQPMEQVLN